MLKGIHGEWADGYKLLWHSRCQRNTTLTLVMQCSCLTMQAVAIFPHLHRRTSQESWGWGAKPLFFRQKLHFSGRSQQPIFCIYEKNGIQFHLARLIAQNPGFLLIFFHRVGWVGQSNFEVYRVLSKNCSGEDGSTSLEKISLYSYACLYIFTYIGLWHSTLFLYFSILLVVSCLLHSCSAHAFGVKFVGVKFTNFTMNVLGLYCAFLKM